MPEYLSPGVFIEEVPARLKAIEGVSTSTAGFVGAAERGTVPGYPLPPFTLPAGVTFEFPVDRGPVLTTSFAEFTRSFGGPLALVRTGDSITLDVPARRLTLNVDEAELTRRRTEWQAPPPVADRGWYRLYIDHVSQADTGCDLDFLVGASGSTISRESH